MRPYESESSQVWRPFGRGGTSFPSGHTSCAFTAATSLSLSFRCAGLQTLFFGWAILIGLQRIYTGAHWLSDVLAGAALGISIPVALFAARKQGVSVTVVPCGSSGLSVFLSINL